ncbi:MAG: glycosyltransferase family 39 protein [Acidobacteriota bacterium]|nr:glycosyltransferase family 39 protein [Acidobacteriota bacterium]
MRNRLPRLPLGVPILLLTVLGALLRFYAIGRQGFWYDESYTALLVGRGPGEMLRLLPQLESTPPLYYCVAWVWVRIFGAHEAGLRSLSALCGTLTIPVAYLAARKLLASWRAALIVAALTACNPFLVWYAQEARAYAMLVLLSACTLLAFAYARERPRTPAVALWALACALALLTHYYAAIIVAPEAAWMLYEHRHSRAVQLGIGAIVLVSLALTPLAVRQSGNRSNHWIEHSSYLLRLRQVPAVFLLGPQIHARELLKFAGFAMVAVAVLLLVGRARRRERQGALLPGALALAGFLLSAITGHSTLLARNLLPIWPAAAIFLAGGLGAARARVTGTAAAAVLCAIGIVGVVSVDTTEAFQRPDWRLLASALGRWPAQAQGDTRGDGRIVLIQDNPSLLPLELYLKDLRYIRTPAVHRIVAIDVVAALPQKGLGGFCWWGSECNLVPSRLDRSYAIPGFRIVARRRVRDFGILELRASRPMTVPVSSLPVPPGYEQHRQRVRAGSQAVADARLVEQGR